MRTRRRSLVYRGIALLGLCSWLVGCHKWVAMDEPYPESITAEHPSQVRVTTQSGEAELKNPRVEADTLVGYSDQVGETRVPLDQVEKVEEWKTDGPALAGLIGLVALVFVLAALAAPQPSDFAPDWE